MCVWKCSECNPMSWLEYSITAGQLQKEGFITCYSRWRLVTAWYTVILTADLHFVKLNQSCYFPQRLSINNKANTRAHSVVFVGLWGDSNSFCSRLKGGLHQHKWPWLAAYFYHLLGCKSQHPLTKHTILLACWSILNFSVPGIPETETQAVVLGNNSTAEESAWI